MITLNQAKGLTHGQILYHVNHRNADGSPQRWRVNGRPKVWVRSPHKVKVPVKHGLWSYDYITDHDLGLVCLDEQSALGQD